MNPELQRKLQAEVERLSREQSLAIEGLTREQVVSAFVQAIACGDFQRHVVVGDRFGDHRQAVTYIPYKGEQEAARKVRDLKKLIWAIVLKCGGKIVLSDLERYHLRDDWELQQHDHEEGLVLVAGFRGPQEKA